VTQLGEEILNIARQCCGSELKLDVLKKKLYQHVNKMTRAEIMELWEEGLRDIFEKHYKILLTGSKKTYGRELGYVVYARNWRSNLMKKASDYVAPKKPKVKQYAEHVDVGSSPGVIGPFKIYNNGDLDLDVLEIAVASIRSMISDEQFDEILVKTEKR